MARPSIINDALIEAFCFALRVSGSIETAIELTGIGRASYYRWAREVRQGKRNALQEKFMRAVEKAEAETKLQREYQLSKHFDKHWRALAWWFERKYSDEYGRRRPLPPLDPDALVEPRQPRRIVWVKAPAAPIKAEPVPAAAQPAEALEDAPSKAVERTSDAWVTGTYCETLGRELLTGHLDRPRSPLRNFRDNDAWHDLQ